MKLVANIKKHAIDFVNTRLGENFGEHNTVAHGVLDNDGRLVAGWVWHNYNPDCETIEFSGASITRRWMTRRILHELFSYAFSFSQMVVTRNAADNVTLHRQLAAFGFRRYDIGRLFGRDEDGVVWTLTDDDWKASKFYLGADNGQEIRRARSA